MSTHKSKSKQSRINKLMSFRPGMTIMSKDASEACDEARGITFSGQGENKLSSGIKGRSSSIFNCRTKDGEAKNRKI